MFNGFGQAAAAAACVVILMAYIITGIAIAPNQARHKTGSNKRAMMTTCPPSSASTAENSPATDHAVPTASRNAPHGSTPGPRATPLSEASATHIVYALRQWWQQRRSVQSAAGHRPRQTP